MNSRIITLIALVALLVTSTLIGWLFGLFVLLVFFVGVVVLSSVALAGINHCAAPEPKQELDLQRILQNRAPTHERDRVTDTGRVIYRDLRTQLEPGSHERHADRKPLNP